MSDRPAFHCPRCRFAFTWSPEWAGRIIRCQNCGEQFQAPAAAAGPPAPPPPASVSSFAFEGAVDATQRFAEPWYYRFIENYTRFFMWLGVAIVFFAAIGLTVAFSSKFIADAREDYGLSKLNATIAYVYFLAVLASALAGILFSAALFLLAVDMGRNLRTLVSQGRRRS